MTRSLAVGLGLLLGLAMARAGAEVTSAPTTRPASGARIDPFAPPAQLTSPRVWFQAAAAYAAADVPPTDADDSPARRDLRRWILSNLIYAQVRAGDAEGALASARKFAPHELPTVADAQAWQGDAAGALATAGMISDAKEKQEAFYHVTENFIRLGRPADARRALKERAGDEVTAGLYQNLAEAQAKAGDIAGAQASIKDILDTPNADALNGARGAEAYIALAAAQYRAGDRQAYRASLDTARQLTKDLRLPYPGTTLARMAHVQAEIGDYDGATATLGAMDPENVRARGTDLVLAAQVRRGDVTPAQALAKVAGYSPVYEEAMAVQLAAKDPKAAAQTLKIATGRDFLFTEFPTGIVDGFLAAGDVDGAAGFVAGLTDPIMRAQLYGHLAAQRAAAGDQPRYQAFIAKATASATAIVDPPRWSSTARPHKSQVLGELAQIQANAKDFEGARKTVALIDEPQDRDRWAIELRARELAAGGKLEEARAWVATLPDAQDQAQACLSIAMELLPASKRR